MSNLLQNLYYSFTSCRGTVAAINTQVCTGHERTALRKKEYCWGLEVLWGSQSPEESTGHPDFLDFWVGIEKSVCHIGSDILLSHEQRVVKYVVINSRLETKC